MPFTDFVGEQLLDLQNFLTTSPSVVRVVRIDPEMRSLFLRLLAGVDEEADFPHVLIAHYDGFGDPNWWFYGLEAALKRQIEEFSDALAKKGVSLGGSRAFEGPAPVQFLRLAEQVTESLPDNIGSLAFVIDPDEMEDRLSFIRSIEFLATYTSSPWLRFIVLDDLQAPLLTELSEAHPRVTYQIFRLSPEEMVDRQDEKDALASLQSPSGKPLASPLAAAVAFANKDYARAEALQRAEMETTEPKSPMEQVVEQYNLGSTLLADQRADEAAPVLLSACDLASTHRLNEIAPMVYMNLGIALHRLHEFDQAFEALKVANRFFKAEGNRPGEAFVCDNLALMYHELGRRDEAVGTWRYALALYEGITNPDMHDVRDAGCTDIRAKLDRVGEAADG